MKLYLHIGTEKTGSSFIQSYLANNRKILLKHNIFFPTAGKREADMKAGRISPGNASQLNLLLDNGKWDSASEWLKQKKIEAEHQNCSKVLLSNEILIKTFSKENVLQQFIQLCDLTGFECQDLLLIIREPVSQALSLYKHRSKRGGMQPIKEWLHNHYSLPDCLERFYTIQENSKLVGLEQYPYQKSSNYLIDVCINKWLKLDEVIEPKDHQVNPSLTLSELKVLSEIKKKDSFLALTFYNRMIKIDSKEKADDKAYKDNISAHINNYLVAYNGLWEKCHTYMSKNSEIFHYEEINHEDSELEVNFSKTQVQEFSDVMVYSSRMIFFLLKLKFEIKSLISQFKIKSIVNNN